MSPVVSCINCSGADGQTLPAVCISEYGWNDIDDDGDDDTCRRTKARAGKRIDGISVCMSDATGSSVDRCLAGGCLLVDEELKRDEMEKWRAAVTVGLQSAASTCVVTSFVICISGPSPFFSAEDFFDADGA